METTDTKQDTTKTKEQQSEFIICPCCGKPTLTRPVKVKEALLDHYMACIISGVPFSHTYPVYEGRMNITVSQLDRVMVEKLRALDKALAAWKDALQNRADMAQELNNLVKLYCSVPEVQVKAGTQTKVFQPASIVTDVCDRVAKQYTEWFGVDGKPGYEDACSFVQSMLDIMNAPSTTANVPVQLMIAVVESHNQIYNILLGSGFDANFWEGIELA